MNDVIFNEKTDWVQDETVQPADANRWEKGIKDCADLVNDHNEKIPSMDTKIDKKVNKSGDSMAGQLVMEENSNGIKFKGPDTPAGWVGGDQDLTDAQKEILYNFFYPTDPNTIEWISQHPLKAGESYHLYSGTKPDPGYPTIIYNGIGFIDSNNLYCTYGGGLSTSPTDQWWSNPSDYGITITLNRAVTKNNAPTSYQEASTNNFYDIKYGPEGLLQKNDNEEVRLLNTKDKIAIITNAFPDYSSGVVISSGTVLSFNALVIAKGSPGGYNTIILYADGEVIWAGGVSENSARFRAGGAYCAAGTTITAANAHTITAYPMIQ